MLKSTKLKNTLLVGATAILVSCGGQKEIKMGSYAYDAQFLKDHGIEYTLIPQHYYKIFFLST